MGGRFCYRMERKDALKGFDYSGVYIGIVPLESIKSMGDDGRKTLVEFQDIDNTTFIRETFEPDNVTPISVQRNFTQSVLNRFKFLIEKKEGMLFEEVK